MAKKHPLHSLPWLAEDMGLPQPIEHHRYVDANAAFDCCFRWAWTKEQIGIFWVSPDDHLNENYHDQLLVKRNRINQAAARGWLVLELSAEMVADGRAADFLRGAFTSRLQSPSTTGELANAVAMEKKMRGAKHIKD